MTDDAGMKETLVLSEYWPLVRSRVQFPPLGTVGGWVLIYTEKPVEVGGRNNHPEANRREEKKGMESRGRVLTLPAQNLLKPGGQTARKRADGRTRLHVEDEERRGMHRSPRAAAPDGPCWSLVGPRLSLGFLHQMPPKGRGRPSPTDWTGRGLLEVWSTTKGPTRRIFRMA